MNTTRKYIYGKDVIDIYNFKEPNSNTIKVFIVDSKGDEFQSKQFELTKYGNILNWKGNIDFGTIHPTNQYRGKKNKAENIPYMSLIYNCSLAGNQNLIEINSSNINTGEPFSTVKINYEFNTLNSVEYNEFSRKVNNIEEYFYNKELMLVRKTIVSKNEDGNNSHFAEEFIIDSSNFIISKKTKWSYGLTNMNIKLNCLTQYNYNKTGQLIGAIDEIEDDETLRETTFRYQDKQSDRISFIETRTNDNQEHSSMEFKYDDLNRVQTVICKDLKNNNSSKTSYIRN